MHRLLFAVIAAIALAGLLAWAVAGVARASREGSATGDRVLKGGTTMQNVAFGLLFALIVYVALFGGA